MKLGGIAAGRLRRSTVIEPVWLAPSKSTKHMGYENTTRDMENSTRQLRKECLVLAKGISLKFKPLALQDSGGSVDVIRAKPMAVWPYGALGNP